MAAAHPGSAYDFALDPFQLRAIDALGTVAGPSVCLRIIDQPKEFARPG